MMACGITLFYEAAWKLCNYEVQRRFRSIVFINLFEYRAFYFTLVGVVIDEGYYDEVTCIIVSLDLVNSKVICSPKTLCNNV